MGQAVEPSAIIVEVWRRKAYQLTDPSLRELELSVVCCLRRLEEG